MLYDLLTVFSVIYTIGITAAGLWFIFAVGVPLRRYLRRELGEELSQPTRH